MNVTKTDKRILHKKLNMLKEKNERSFQFFLDNPQYFKGSTVIKNKLRRYNKTLRAVRIFVGVNWV